MPLIMPPFGQITSRVISRNAHYVIYSSRRVELSAISYYYGDNFTKFRFHRSSLIVILDAGLINFVVLVCVIVAITFSSFFFTLFSQDGLISRLRCKLVK